MPDSVIDSQPQQLVLPLVLSSPHQGESPLHTACVHGLSKLVKALLEAGANPNAQTASPLGGATAAAAGGDASAPSGVYRETPLHCAISHRHEPVVRVFLEYKGEYTEYMGVSTWV